MLCHVKKICFSSRLLKIRTMRGFLFIFSYFSGCAKLLFMANLCSIYFMVSYIISQRGGGALYLMFWSVLGPVTTHKPSFKMCVIQNQIHFNRFEVIKKSNVTPEIDKIKQKQKTVQTAWKKEAGGNAKHKHFFLLGHAHRPNSDYIMLIGLCIGPIIEVICRAVF